MASSSKKDSQEDRAQRAVRAFRAMQPGLSGYARAITGRRDVRVEISTGRPRTDGTVIYFRPPIALGDGTSHKRGLCERRDPATDLLLCDACAVRESVLVTIYHEIAHITFGTFEQTSPEAISEAMIRAIEEAPGKYANKIRADWDSDKLDSKKSDYLNLSSLVSPHLPTIVNVLEDARIDESMFRARKGTKIMFDAYFRSIFTNGNEVSDGVFSKWSDAPLNSQAVIGVFVLACGYDYAGWFHPVVEEALGDSELRNLVGKIESIRSAAGTYNLAFPILARLRDLGFLRNPDEEEEEEEEEDDVNEQGEDSPEDDDSADGDGDSESDDGPESEPTDSECDAPDEGEPKGDQDGPDTEGSDSGEAEGASGDEEPESLADEPEDDAGDSGEAGSGAGAEDSVDDETTDANGAESASEEGGNGGQDLEESEDDDDAAPGTPWSSDSDSDQPSGDSDDLSDEDGASDDDVEAEEPQEELNWGTPEDAMRDVQAFSHHEEGDCDDHEDTPEEESAIDIAISQGEHFDRPSTEIAGVRLHKFGVPQRDSHGCNISTGWSDQFGILRSGSAMIARGALMEIPEQILGPALLEMRRAFTDNARGSSQRNLKAGRINSRSLGKRAPVQDPRLFQKKRMSGKKSYSVILGIDISGSTMSGAIGTIIRACAAQAELCQRAGIDFAVYAHTGNGDCKSWQPLHLDMYEIKAFGQAWDDKAREALKKINSDAANLDGHTLEFYRKLIEKQASTEKIIMYYTDGDMPLENFKEELMILQREIAYCKARKITVMGVGVGTDSPIRHGLDTVRVDGDEDIVKVVRHLQAGLLHNR